MIHCESIEDVYRAKHIPFWLVSAFKSGFLNSAGFLLTGEFVSHITGFGTRVGITMGHEGYIFGLELLIIPAAFIFGGVVTSMMLDPSLKSNQFPPYHRVQALITALIGVIVLIGESHLIDETVQFGADENYSFIEFFVISLLCFVCGLKNGLVAWTTQGKIRVTHLTGLATDIGLNLLYTLKRRRLSPRFREGSRVNVLRFGILFCFSTGAFVSAILFPQVGYKGFLVVFVISLVMTLVSSWNAKKLQHKDSAELTA